MNKLFDVPVSEKKTAKRGKQFKQIPLDKYIIMCEKEAVVFFLHDFCPYAYAPKRINAGALKGAYEVIIPFCALNIGAAHWDSMQDENNCKIVEYYLEEFCLKCGFAHIEFRIGWKGLNCGWNYAEDRQVKLTVKINNSFKNKIINDYGANIKAEFA